MPGRGKSVLARSLLDENLLATNPKTSATCFFFFKDSQEGQDTASHALSAILHRLFSKTPGKELLKHVKQGFKDHRENLKNLFGAMWEILINTASDPNAGEIVCLIDALDECQPNSLKVFMDQIIEFYSLVMWDRPKLKFIVTSRPYADIKDFLSPLEENIDFFHINIDKEYKMISNDIKIVLRYEVPKRLYRLEAKDHEEIIEHITKKPQATYLWTRLIFELLKKEPASTITVKEVKKAIDRSPESMNELYLALLQKAGKQAHILLKLIFAARRPLSVGELNIAWSLVRDEAGICTSISDLDVADPEGITTAIQDTCGLLVTIEDDHIQFLHQTVREFLASGISNTAYSWQPFSEVDAEQAMAQICTKHLFLNDFESPTIDFTKSADEIEKSLSAFAESFDFLIYASSHWMDHYEKVRFGRSASDSKAGLQLCVANSARCKMWFGLWLRANNWPTSEIGRIRDSDDEAWTDMGIALVVGAYSIVGYMTMMMRV